MTATVNGAALTLDKIDEVIDLVKPGKPDVLIMSKKMRRKMKSLQFVQRWVLRRVVQRCRLELHVDSSVHSFTIAMAL